MNQSGKQYEELLTLCWDYQAGELSDDGAKRLEQIVLNDDDACTVFVRYSALCANLEWEGVVEPGPLGRPVEYKPLPQSDLAELNKRQAVHQRRISQNHFSTLLMFLPAAIIVTAGLALYFGIFNKTEPTHLVAHVVRSVDARWEQDEKVWETGDTIHSGEEFHLEQGLIEIELTSGARVVVEGPALFIPHQQDNVELQFGSLFAHAPKTGTGFIVETPSARVVDLGTKFGVTVSQTGVVEVHVIEGRVETSLLNSFGSVVESRRLAANEAVRVVPRSQEISDIDIHPESFVQSTARHQKNPVLVAHWRLNEEQDAMVAKDLSGNQLHLSTVPNEGISPFTGLAGPSGFTTAAGPFLKQNHQLRRVLTKAEAGKFDVTNFTIEMWARNPSIRSTKNPATLLHYRRNTNVYKVSQFNLYTSNVGNSSLGISYLTTDGRYVVHNSSSQLKWNKDGWYHIVLTYNANSSAPNDSIITITRTPERETDPDFSKTFTDTEDIAPLVANGNLIIGGSTNQNIPRHWGGDIDNVKFINGIPGKYSTTKDKSKQ